jgi:hypothetical protein
VQAMSGCVVHGVLELRSYGSFSSEHTNEQCSGCRGCYVDSLTYFFRMASEVNVC